MNEDKILSMFFEPERWQNAISKGIDKDMNKATPCISSRHQRPV